MACHGKGTRWAHKVCEREKVPYHESLIRKPPVRTLISKVCSAFTICAKAKQNLQKEVGHVMLQRSSSAVGLPFLCIPLSRSAHPLRYAVRVSPIPRRSLKPATNRDLPTDTTSVRSISFLITLLPHPDRPSGRRGWVDTPAAAAAAATNSYIHCYYATTGKPRYVEAITFS